MALPVFILSTWVGPKADTPRHSSSISFFQAEGDDGPGGVEPEGAGLPGVHHHHRGAAAGRTQHGPSGVR